LAHEVVPALQLAKLSGFSPIITTSSPSNYGLLKSLGATHTLDRNALGSLAVEVAKITSEPVLYAYDAWSSAETQQALYDLLAPNGGLVLVLPKAVKEVADKNITIRNAYGSVHRPANRQIGVSLFGALEGLLANGTIKVEVFVTSAVTSADFSIPQPNPVEILPNGLEGIIDGLARMAADKVSGKKLIAKPQETA
jgi:NADPH:quinone reductase-like Zn-dependent oxidoreductase